jgi:hypothetical protein
MITFVKPLLFTPLLVPPQLTGQEKHQQKRKNVASFLE